MSLDCIVVNYRTPEDLHRFIASYATIDKPPGNLFVYNVDPDEEDRKVVALWEDKITMESLESLGNIGYAQAVNEWARYSRSDVMAIFNADVVLTSGSLNRCYRELVAHLDWGILGPRQIDEFGRITHAGILGKRGEPHTHRLWHAQSGWLEGDDEDLILDDVVTVMGSAMFVKRACWQQLATCGAYIDHLNDAWSHARPYGAMLPTKLYYEETFMCYHAIEHDWKVVYYGPVTIVHEWHKSIDKHVPQDEEIRMVETSRKQFNEACVAVHGMPHYDPR